MEAAAIATDAQVSSTPAVIPPAPKAGRPRVWPDLAPGETGTYEQRKAIKNRERRRQIRAVDVEAFNRHQMELYHARFAKQKADAQKLADLMAMLTSMMT